MCATTVSKASNSNLLIWSSSHCGYDGFNLSSSLFKLCYSEEILGSLFIFFMALHQSLCLTLNRNLFGHLHVTKLEEIFRMVAKADYLRKLKNMFWCRSFFI